MTVIAMLTSLVFLYQTVKMSQSLFDFMFCGMVCWDLVDSKWLLSQRPNVLMFTSFGDIWQYILSVTFLALVNYSKTLNFSFSQSLPFLVLSLQESTFCKRYFLPLKGKNKFKKKNKAYLHCDLIFHPPRAKHREEPIEILQTHF